MPNIPISEPAARARLLVEQMTLLPDNQARLLQIVERARREPPLPDALRRDDFKIAGCVSELWLVPAFEGERLRFLADATAAIPKGVALLLCDVYSGGTPAEILALGDDFIREAGLPQMLSANRSNGLSHLHARILRHASTAALSP